MHDQFHRTLVLAIAAGLLILLGHTMFSPANAADRNTYKKTVTLWYQAFDNDAPNLLDKVLSDEASYVYGQMLVVDGGMTIGGFAFE